MRLQRSDLASVDLERLRSWAADPSEFFRDREHYRLLASLSERVPKGDIVDVGTHQGSSALALSYGGSPVLTFDIVDNVGDRPRAPGVRYIRSQEDNLLTEAGREKWREELLAAPLIFVDTDPHDGAPELELVQWLHRNSYLGLLVLDDIWFFKGMRDRLWSQIDDTFKIDATELGHWSGTGLVSFEQRLEVEGQVDTSNWTLVTGYFDLTGKDDATDAIRARPRAHYIESRGGGTLGMNSNLVVFCDPGLEEAIWSMRPAQLHARTRVITADFEQFPLSRHHARIVENRGGGACRRDPRNTASYYLFCMARLEMLRQAMRENPFRSTHFGWVNICVERMGWQNLARLGEALGCQRDRVSTCFIDYVPKDLANDLESYFGAGGCSTPSCAALCSMCSGFYTGRADHLARFADAVEKKFLSALAAGYGHADEQLFVQVYHDHTEWFDWYPGDYAEMITNYKWVRERPEQPIRNLVAHALAAGDREVWARATRLLIESERAGYCSITEAIPGL